jgi:hypothetical protein
MKGSNHLLMRFIGLLAVLCLNGCNEVELPSKVQQGQAVNQKAINLPAILAPLIDPAKLDSLKGKRAATPRLRKACYWLEMARRDGDDLATVLDEAHALTGHHKPERMMPLLKSEEEREGRSEATGSREKVAPSRTSQR